MFPASSAVGACEVGGCCLAALACVFKTSHNQDSSVETERTQRTSEKTKTCPHFPKTFPPHCSYKKKKRCFAQRPDSIGGDRTDPEDSRKSCSLTGPKVSVKWWCGSVGRFSFMTPDWKHISVWSCINRLKSLPLDNLDQLLTQSWCVHVRMKVCVPSENIYKPQSCSSLLTVLRNNTHCACPLMSPLSKTHTTENF